MECRERDVETASESRELMPKSERGSRLGLHTLSNFEEVLRAWQGEYDARLSAEVLLASQRFLQSALDALSAQIAIVEFPNRIVAVNASWRRFADDNAWTWPNAGVGTSYLEVWRQALGPDQETVDLVAAGLHSARGTPTCPFAIEYQTRNVNAPRWFTLSATPFVELGVQLLAIEHQEVTARKQLEQQFHHAQKMEAIGQLAGGVAHDFNNMLLVIRSYSELLLEGMEGDDPRRADCSEIVHAADSAAALTRQLLAFSRKQVLQPIVMNLNVAVTALDQMLRRLISETVDYVAVLEPNPGAIKADSGQMQQILMNLVVNARDAMPDGGTVTVETSNLDLHEPLVGLHSSIPPGRYVVLRVSDTGSGMSLATQARIFEPFFTTKEVGKGTGLGLSTVYGIVKQSHGHIGVQSEVGRGSVFEIYLPRVDRALETTRAAATGLPKANDEVLLVVEDRDIVRGAIGRVLRRAGYHVLEADGGDEALAIAQQHAGTIDLLISDVIMPKTSGPDLARELRGLRPDMKVLFMSGYAGTELSSGADLRDRAAFLEKPSTPSTIVRRVRETLDEVRS